MTDDPNNRRRSFMLPTLPAVAVLAIVSLAVGVLAAFAADADSRTGRPALPTPLPAPRPCPVTPAPKAPAVAAVPQDILDAFGVLRRDAADADVLPAEALRALRARGLEPFDPAAARLLRTTPEGGRAWVVPVRDTAVGLSFGCRMGRAIVAPRLMLDRRVRPAARWRSTPFSSAVPVAPTRRSTRPPRPAAPRPGLAVVALSGAPAGGGGALADLVRGRAAVASDPCSGPNRDMLTVSGIVPDGVATAFLTSPDGTAVRADVKDNAYAFVVPRPKTPEPRYVVWTGADGTPHVAPIRGAFVGLPGGCATSLRDRPAVTPAGMSSCSALVAPPARAARPSLHSLAQSLLAEPCAALAPTLPTAPAPEPRRRR